MSDKGILLSAGIAARLKKLLQWAEPIMRRNVAPLAIGATHPQDVILQKFGKLVTDLSRTAEAEVRIWYQDREDGNVWTEGDEDDVETAYGRLVPSGEVLPAGTFVELTRNRQTGFFLATQSDDCPDDEA
jgi:hypothetical protein